MFARFGSYLSNLFAADLGAFGGPSPDEATAGHIRGEQLALVLRHTPSMMLANVCNATILALALWQSPDRVMAIAWASTMFCGAVYFGARAQASRRIAKPQSVSRRAIHRLVRNAFMLGIMWAIVPASFFANATTGGQLVITCLCAGLLAGGAFAFATIPIAAIAFTAPIFIGTAICVGRNGDLAYLLVAVLVVTYACILLRGVLTYAFGFTHRLMLQFETAKAVRLDSLTRLPNRLSLNESLESALAEIDRPEGGFSLLLLDLDGFKLVNDHLGHPAGDEFLVQLAARLRRCTNESEIVARIGGDEFALLGPAKPEAASELADRIAAVFADPFVIDGQNIIGSTTVGIALAPRDGRTSNDLFEHVDIALYRAKKAGPATTRFFEADDDLVAKERRALQRDLEKAIERDELFILYQPLFNLSENRITGFEALLRWRHPRRGIIPPVEFIAIAEQSGLIHAIGGWAIRQACAELSRWPRDIRVSVNCSAIQFQNANILATVVRALEETEISPERLEIEITESMLIARYGSALLILQSLLELGVTVALDDFGTGFSSLTYLRKLPFRRIKVDQSFIREMLTVPDCAAIVQSVIRLAHELRMEVVAEGVETIEQLDYLRKTDCNEVQGYLIGRPMPAEKVCEMLDNQVPQTALA